MYMFSKTHFDVLALSMPQYLSTYFLTKFGIKSLAKKNCAQLLASVAKYMDQDIKVCHFSVMSHLHPMTKWSEPEAHFYFQLNSVINQFAFKGDGKVKTTVAAVSAIVFKKIVIGDKLHHSLSACFDELAAAKATDLDVILDGVMDTFVKHNEHQSTSLLTRPISFFCPHSFCAFGVCQQYVSITLFSWLTMSMGMAA